MVKRNVIATKLTKTYTQTQKRPFDVAVVDLAKIQYDMKITLFCHSHRCIDLWCGWELPPEIDGPAKHTDEQRQWDCCRCAEELNEKMKKRKRIVNDLFKARNPNATRKDYPFEVKPITCPWGKYHSFINQYS